MPKMSKGGIQWSMKWQQFKYYLFTDHILRLSNKYSRQGRKAIGSVNSQRHRAAQGVYLRIYEKDWRVFFFLCTLGNEISVLQPTSAPNNMDTTCIIRKCKKASQP